MLQSVPERFQSFTGIAISSVRHQRDMGMPPRVAPLSGLRVGRAFCWMKAAQPESPKTPMPIYEFAREEIRPLLKTTFGQMQLHERRDLQRLLRENISVIAPDTLVIAEEFGEWDESRRRVDLLGVDREANLVVIELKRTEDGGHMELQALRYADMVSTMTFDKRLMSSVGISSRLAKTIWNRERSFWTSSDGTSSMKTHSHRT